MLEKNVSNIMATLVKSVISILKIPMIQLARIIFMYITLNKYQPLDKIT